MSLFSKKTLKKISVPQAGYKHLNLCNHALLGISEIDSSGKFRNANERFCGFTRFSEAQLQDMNLIGLCVNKTDDNDLRDQLEETFSAGREYFDADLHLHRKDNDYIWLRCFFHLIKEESSKTCYIRILAFDITVMKIEAQDRQKSEENFRLLAGVTFEGIVLHKQGVIFEVNDSFCKITGYSREECIGANLLQYVATGKSLEIVKENVKKNYAKPYIITARRKNGSSFMAELEARMIDYQTGACCFEGDEKFQDL